MVVVAACLLVAAVLLRSPLPSGMLVTAALGLVAVAAWGAWRAPRGSSHSPDAAHRHERQGEARFRSLLESLPNIAVQGYDRHRRVIFWNEESTRLYGYRFEEAHGQRLEELIIPPAMRGRVMRDHQAWIQEGQAIPPGRLVLQDKNGRPVTVFSYHVMLDEDTADPVMFCVDVRLDSEPPPDVPSMIDSSARHANSEDECDGA